MSEAKHTPGQWNNDCSGNITHQDGQPIAFVNWTAYDAGQENARLIAAAPDLLDALRICATQSTGPDWTPEQALAFIKQHARAAIAKATGGAA